MDQAISTGMEHLRAGRLPQAEQAAVAALQRNSGDADAWRLYGRVAERVGRGDVAVEALRKAAALRPGDATLHFDLANAQRVSGQLDVAVASYREALRLNPRFGDALLNLGIALANSGAREEAAKAWEAALQLDPKDADAWANLGNLYRLLGRLADSIRCSERSLKLLPDRASTISNLGVALEQQGRLDEAIAHYRRAMELSPRSAYVHSNLLMDLTYHGSIAPAEVFAEHRRWNDLHAAPLAALIEPHPNDRDADRRLRIGYVSADLRNHSIAYFMEPVLSRHDRENFDIYCYSAAPHPDEVTQRLQSHGHTWRSIVGLRDAQAGEMIHADRIDILVDLAVHTAGHRLRLFATKPAPVQVTWLGYAGTTGLQTVDWRITDPFVDPPGLTELLHSERLMRLPRTQWCYRPSADAPEVLSPPGESSGFITFGNATNLAKVTPQVIELWSRVLREVPGSRLAMKAQSFTDAETVTRMADAFASHGIDRQRLRLEPAGQMREYLDFLNSVDICLDTFPFTGGTTTCHTLWMGVPVLTMTGATSVSRVAASVLTNVGLGDLVAASMEEFVAIAKGLAGDAARLQTLRRELRTMMQGSPLCDAAAFVRDLESAFRTMWREWCTR